MFSLEPNEKDTTLVPETQYDTDKNPGILTDSDHFKNILIVKEIPVNKYCYS